MSLSDAAAGPCPWVARWFTLDEVRPEWVTRLDAGERARHDARRTSDERARLLGAAVLMRELLAEAAGCAVDEVGLDRTCACGRPHGRPVPTGAATGWHVSASHSGPFVLAAVSRQPIGVDVELVRAQPPSPSLLRRVMAPGEGMPEGAAGFAGVWSAKEAYLKATGTGLVTPMATVRVAGEQVTSTAGAWPPGRLTPLPPPLAIPAAVAHVCVLSA